MADSGGDIIRCDACPVLCRFREAKAGTCDHYAIVGSKLSRLEAKKRALIATTTEASSVTLYFLL